MTVKNAEIRAEVFRLRYVEQLAWPKIYARYLEIPQSTLRYFAGEERKKREDAGETVNGPLRALPPKRPQHKVEFTEKGDEATAFSISPRIKTLEQLLEAAEVDLERWQINSWTTNKWEMAANVDGDIVITPLFQVKAHLGPNKTVQAQQLISDLREDARQFSPKAAAKPTAVTTTKGGHLLEISVFDLHFGKWAWSAESGQGYDMDTAERLFEWAVEYLLEKGSQAVDGICQILLPLGNDLFNADGMDGLTTRGTPQDMHGSHRQHFRRVRQMARRTIDRLSKVAPVKVVMVPGNHDMETVYYLGEALDDWYANNEWVEVDNDPLMHKYHQHGRNLIGFTHGNEEKVNTLPLIMAQEAPGEWADTLWREWHVGHLHRKREFQYLPVDEFNGVRVRVIPSLCATDEWHYRRGYVKGIRAAEAYAWHLEHGLVGQFSAPVTLMGEGLGR